MTEDKNPPPVESGQGGFLDNLGLKLSQKLHNAFYSLGEFVGTYPWRVIGVATLIVLLCGLGISQLEEETRREKLWVPGGTPAQRDKRHVDAVYGNGQSDSLYRIEKLLITVDNGDTDILEPATFDRLLELHTTMRAVTAVYEGENLTFSKLCNKRGPDCYVNNILELFQYDSANWNTKDKIVAKLNSNSTSSDGLSEFNVGRVLGGLSYDAASSLLTGAKGFALEYWLNNNETKSGNEYSDERALEWEDEWLDTADDAEKDQVKYPGWSIDRFAGRSFSDEFGGAISADISLLQIAILLTLVYATLMLSRWSKGCLGFRGLVVVAGIVSIGFAIVATYGLCAGAGLMFTPLMNILPFLILALGVDDMFVIVNALDSLPDSDVDMPIPRRLALTMAKAGPSITLTSLTDFSAFLIGANTTLPALSKFSIYCAVGILFDFALQITFFLGWLALDLRRKGKAKGDCMFCCGPLALTEGETCCGCKKKDDDTLKHLVQYKLAEPMCKPMVKVGVIVLFTALGAVGLVGALSIKVQADETDFLPTGSYLLDYFDVVDAYFTTTGSPTAVYLESGIDYSNSTIWPMMEELFTIFKNTKLIDSADSWIMAFLASPLHNVTEANFYDELHDFLNNTGAFFLPDVVFDPADDNVIIASRLSGFHVYLDKSYNQVDSMDNIRSSIKNSKIAENEITRVFAYGPDYLTYEQYKSIGKEAATNLSLAMLAVSVIIFINIINPVASGLVILSVGLVVMNIVGFMHWWSLNIDSITVIMLVLALGLSVDYSAHVAHGFMHKQGTGNERMVEAMIDIGVAVINGAVSTLCAVVVLAWSNSYVFQAFFKQLLLCIIFGLGHGMVFLPVLLSLVAPKPFKVTIGSEEDDKHLHATRMEGSNPKLAEDSENAPGKEMDQMTKH